ncbi:hypothetical protein CKJ81_05500 [Corynebacterium hadale]|uniref:DUF721 domain-containing protein n=1 Tax=Corynebacterium hadale TaxID=2026255 RepID=A0ABX4H9P0_9CORY|nr:DciA family protein [Corynebacterium hadale]PAT06025.1 hypothetical protein CKJ81_05500 [Corynebacterium hadale]
MSDLVSDTFNQLRETVRRSGRRLPNLRKQGANVTPRRSVGKRALTAGTTGAPGEGEGVAVPGLHFEEQARRPWVRRGRPTGKDGRALARGYEVASFSALLGKEVRQRDWTENIAYGWVMGNWEGLVGAKIAQHTKVEMIKNGEVHITCDSTAWASNLKYMQSTILRAISEKLGPDVITKLHIFGPKTKSWRYGPLHVKGRGPRDTYG